MPVSYIDAVKRRPSLNSVLKAFATFHPYTIVQSDWMGAAFLFSLLHAGRYLS